MSELMLAQDHGQVRLLTLNRPDRLNALNRPLRAALMRALGDAAADDAVRAVVVTGAGRAFSAGADLHEFEAFASGQMALESGEFTGVEFPQGFADFPKPLVAAVNGAAVGWGFTMPLMADVRLASTKARFICGFLRVGLTPEFGSSHLLPAIVGLGRALEMVLTAREVGPAEAKEIGLVSEVCEPDDLVPRALEVAAVMAGWSAPAVRRAREIVRFGAQHTLAETIGPELDYFRQSMATPEHAEAVAQMLERIKARA